MSFALTTTQVLAMTKTVTRRTGWTFLKPGDVVRAVEKAQGLKKGEKVKPLATLEIVDVRREPLSQIERYPDGGADEVTREGFPRMRPIDFIQWFAETHRCQLDDYVTRIEFRYVAPVMPA